MQSYVCFKLSRSQIYPSDTDVYLFCLPGLEKEARLPGEAMANNQPQCQGLRQEASGEGCRCKAHSSSSIV